MERKLLSIKNIKELYGISRITLINWEKKGLLNPIRTPGGQRRYRKEDVEELLNLKEEEEKTEKADTILYARVSTKKQEKYLENQIKRLEEFAKSKGIDTR